MPASTPTNLEHDTEARTAALDRLIWASAQEHYVGGDILIFEDSNYGLTRQILAAAAAVKGSGRIFMRLRSYRQARQLFQILQQKPAETRARIVIAGLTAAGEPETQTMAPADFLAAHNFNGTLACGQLPKSHASLRDWATGFAAHQAAMGRPATLVLGGAVKHMSRAFNNTLAAAFMTVRGLRGKGKHRCLLATAPRPETTATERPSRGPAGPLAAFGGVFSGPKPDRGGELLVAAGLLELAAQQRPLRVLDLGCGNGSVSLGLLRHSSTGQLATLSATDLDMDAVRSAMVNLAGDSRAVVSWDDAGRRIHPESIDLVLLNPPFHEGTKIDMTLVRPLLDAAHRVLRPEGVLLLVHNSHVRYRGAVAKRFKNVTQVERDAVFTVLRAQR